MEHLNLVKWHGYLEHGDDKIIVIEYVNNGTLREHLDGKFKNWPNEIYYNFLYNNQLIYSGVRGNGLEIGERLDVAIDVAHAVTHLHMYTGISPYRNSL